MELHRKHRPKKFKTVLGQEVVITSLKGMLEEGSVPHAMMFIGPSGCGKTTLARILADRLGAGDMDMTELNSSSYRGIDSIREMIASSRLAPMGECRVWIMDEVHKLSNDAQHASLKMLEEVSDTDYYILCTTEPERLIKPLRNRCTTFAVVPLQDSHLCKLLRIVCGREELKIGRDVIDAIVEAADGSARTALVVLDRVRHLPKSSRLEAAKKYTVSEEKVIDLCRALIQNKPWRVVAKILQTLEDDPESVRWAVLGYAGAVLLKSPKPNPRAYTVLEAFSEPFFNTKKHGLTRAAFEVVFGDG